MAREKGMGNLQREKSGRWTLRVGIMGKRYCRSTRTGTSSSLSASTQACGRIFRTAGIVTSVYIEGRRTRTPEATFHSLRHTFVSFAANAGVPLHVVQSIVGHESTAMTRHYYHENEEVLRQAVAAIPAIGTGAAVSPSVARVALGSADNPSSQAPRTEGVPARLRRLERYLAKGLITEAEYAATRQRILDEM